MSFVSWQYGFFLAAVFAWYWLLPLRGRILLVLAGSYFFYGFWDARFLALLLTSTTIDFYCGLAIVRLRVSFARVFLMACLPVLWLVLYTLFGRRNGVVDHWIIGAGILFPVGFAALYSSLWRLPEPPQRRAFLKLSIGANLAVLGFFKYFNFFTKNAVGLLHHFGWDPGWTLIHIILPVGVSFYTFQSISYSVEVYKGKAEPARDFLTFAAYLSFFPQLVAGPIERPVRLLPQFQRMAPWTTENIFLGLRLILIGLFKKVFVADNCALVANYAFDPATSLNSCWALLGVLAFAFQIYGDFSGYTDIARGSARLLGIELSRNFYFPYFAHSPADFWQRWHVSLSTWFRDYVYIPLGGNRSGTFNTLRNLGLTMFLAGLWHGADWIFVLWGLYHAGLLILYRVVPFLRRLDETERLSKWSSLFYGALWAVFNLVGWAIFRSQDPAHLLRWLSALGRWNAAGAVDWVRPALWCLFHIIPLLLLQVGSRKSRDEVEFACGPWPVRGLVYALIFLLIATSVSSDVEFIYFQF